MGYKFIFGNDISDDCMRGLNDKIRYVKGTYPIPDGISKNVAVDIGCNLGSFPIVYSDTFKDIFCFEASYECFHQASFNLRNHDVRNAYIFNLAAYSESGKLIKIKQHENQDNGSNSIIEHHDWNTGVYHNVMSISLEDIFKLCNVEKINFLKVDCEGSEYELLMNKDVSSIDSMIVEIHNHRVEKAYELIEYLKRFFNVVGEHPDPIIEGCRHDMYTFVNKEITV